MDEAIELVGENYRYGSDVNLEIDTLNDNDIRKDKMKALRDAPKNTEKENFKQEFELAYFENRNKAYALIYVLCSKEI